MEKIKLVLVNCLLLLLYSCGSSEDYQGKWKAVNLEGDKYEITFLQKKITIKEISGNTVQHTFIQTGMGHQGSTERTIDNYTILLNNGAKYQIYFPKNDETIGIILDENGVPLFTISRKDFLSYDTFSKLE
ncbi:hypothetical protein EQG68_05620 [Flavobacterium piscinae]|uniref:Lipocalin-like domain-containing protein n=1 Tax=Flavobacterium piscinae TaxID=2506424 RepID=A0A4Q1KTM1_9FLAO|nr:hypothetical protein [Flavobacterium piscinae]RXR32970.1 hypothetical protein EQG68_05620 [Flavobacterium piscinae]